MIKVNYPTDKEQFLKDLLVSKEPGELIANCNLDSNFFEIFSRQTLDTAIGIELFTNVEREEIKLPSGITEIRTIKSTAKYDKLSEIKKEVDYYFNLLLDRMNNPITWTNGIKISGSSCCNSIQNILTELKGKFNPDFPTYTAFFKCFYYHSLTDFDNFRYSEEHLPIIRKQAEMFNGDLKVFFLEKILEDVNIKNQKFKYAERLLTFNSNFKEFFDKKIPKEKSFSTSSNERLQNKPSHRQIALKYRYLQIKTLHEGITDSNKQEIANRYGWTSKNSGHSIYQKFSEVHSTINRTSKKRNTIPDLEAAINMLKDYPEAQSTAMDELRTAKSKA